MAVSKRLRFEILKRDNHACRYCGARAPDVALTVDHVVPETLGGSDDPDNLVAACVDCNGGKASTHPDAPLVADVAQDALRWSRAMAAAAEMQQEDDFEDFLQERVRGDLFGKLWLETFGGFEFAQYDVGIGDWHYEGLPERTYRFSALFGDRPLELFDEYHAAWAWIRQQHEAKWAPRSPNWRDSVRIWYAAGMTLDDFETLLQSVARRRNIKRDQRWRYFCGCVWTRLRQRQDIARTLIADEEGAPREPRLDASV